MTLSRHPVYRELVERLKQATFEVHCTLNENLQLLPVDFSRENPADILKRSAGYRDNAKTIFIAEGLLMCLKQIEVVKLLQIIKGCGKRGSVLIGTALEPGMDGNLNLNDGNWLTNLQLRVIGEPYQ